MASIELSLTLVGRVLTDRLAPKRYSTMLRIKNGTLQQYGLVSLHDGSLRCPGKRCWNDSIACKRHLSASLGIKQVQRYVGHGLGREMPESLIEQADSQIAETEQRVIRHFENS